MPATSGQASCSLRMPSLSSSFGASAFAGQPLVFGSSVLMPFTSGHCILVVDDAVAVAIARSLGLLERRRPLEREQRAHLRRAEAAGEARAHAERRSGSRRRCSGRRTGPRTGWPSSRRPAVDHHRAAEHLGADDQLLVGEAEARARAERELGAEARAGEGLVQAAVREAEAQRIGEHGDVARGLQARRDADLAVAGVLVAVAGRDERLDAEGEGERLAVLAHELHVAADADVADRRLVGRRVGGAVHGAAAARLVHRHGDVDPEAHHVEQHEVAPTCANSCRSTTAVRSLPSAL